MADEEMRQFMRNVNTKLDDILDKLRAVRQCITELEEATRRPGSP